jgi:hypothetical protein
MQQHAVVKRSQNADTHLFRARLAQKTVCTHLETLRQSLDSTGRPVPGEALGPNAQKSGWGEGRQVNNEKQDRESQTRKKSFLRKQEKNPIKTLNPGVLLANSVPQGETTSLPPSLPMYANLKLACDDISPALLLVRAHDSKRLPYNTTSRGVWEIIANIHAVPNCLQVSRRDNVGLVNER